MTNYTMLEKIEKLRITYGKYDIVLNPRVIKNIHQFEQLKPVYIKLFKIFEKMENEPNPIKLYWLNKDIEPLEFEMQKYFGFFVNRNFHRYWYKCPKCTCPRLDNEDVRGTDMRYYNTECIIHGEKTKQLIQRKVKLEKLNENENK